MKLQDIFEAKLNQVDRDKVHEFLSSWTFDHTTFTQGSEKDTTPELFALAKKLYPFKKTAEAFRGLSFATEKELLEFKKSIKTGTLKTDTYTSWSPDDSNAINFSSLEDSKPGKFRYGIVIVGTGLNGIAAFNADDEVDTESEVIVAPGSYKVAIYMEGEVGGKVTKFDSPFAAKPKINPSYDNTVEVPYVNPKGSSATIEDVYDYILQTKMGYKWYNLIGREVNGFIDSGTMWYNSFIPFRVETSFTELLTVFPHLEELLSKSTWRDVDMREIVKRHKGWKAVAIRPNGELRIQVPVDDPCLKNIGIGVMRIPN